jgi:cold shock CspA family protein
MAKSQQSWNKKEREKKKQKEKQDKAEKMQERRSAGGGSKSLEDMMAYIDEDGNIVDSPPDPAKRKEVNIDDIVIGVPKRVEGEEGFSARMGIISFFNEGKGFGFIRDLQTGESIFVHVNNASGPLKENQKVSFETEKGPRGISAVNVKIE